MMKEKPAETPAMREIARGFAKNSIVTQATARLVEQVLTEAHDSRIAPLQAALKRIADYARNCSNDDQLTADERRGAKFVSDYVAKQVAEVSK